jgi:succinoglycan biosynthesis protein ExoA
VEQDLVTVVIPARNEEQWIERCLDSVLAQDHPHLQVIVVDGASTDRTRELVEARMRLDGRVELLHNPDGTIPRSLNLALAASRSPWLVRVDAHAAIPPGYVRRAVAHLQTGRWGGVGGRKDGVGVTPAGKAIAAAMGSRFGVGDSTYHYGTSIGVADHVPFGAYPTAVARELGGWDERLRVNQDFEFDYRVRRSGRRILFDPGLRIEWHCRQTIRELFRQYRRYGRGKAVVAKLHPRSVRPRHLVAPAMVGAWALALLLAPRRPALAVALVAPYGAAVVAASAITARRVDVPAAKVRLPAAFLAMHAGWGVGFWQGLGAAAREKRKRVDP